MKIAALVATHRLLEDCVPRLKAAKTAFDKLVIFIDANRADDKTLQLANDIGGVVYRHEADRWYDWNLQAMVEICDADWVFILEYDEELGSEWHGAGWRRVLEQTDCTHFWLPRRWILPGDRYIKIAPWWPDVQMRLFRSQCDLRFPELLHDPIIVDGEFATLPQLAIHHHVLTLLSRSEREGKVSYYEQLRPGGSLGHFYLHEDFELVTAELPQPATCNAEIDIVSMPALSPAEMSQIQVHLGEVPNVVRTSALLLLDAQVQNDSARVLFSYPPRAVNIAYHWVCERSGNLGVFDGQRSAILPFAAPRSRTPAVVSIFAPPKPGDYVLQVSLVQESVAWFEEVRNETMREYRVSVVG